MVLRVLGDFTHCSDTDGKLIYRRKLDDVNFILKHRGLGILSTRPNKSHTVLSITKECQWQAWTVCEGHGMSIVDSLELSGSEDDKTSQISPSLVVDNSK